MDAWLRDAVPMLGSDVELSAENERVLLDLARVAAHDPGEQTNAPLLCYLVGRLQGERDLGGLAEEILRSSS